MKQLQIRELRMDRLAAGGYRHTIEDEWFPLGEATPERLRQFTAEQIARLQAGEIVLQFHYFRMV